MQTGTLTQEECQLPPVVKYASRGTRYFPADRPILPEWTRHAWASMHERDWWSELISRAGAARIEVEKWAVVDGVRDAAWILASPEQLPELTIWAAKHGLVAQPRTTMAASTNYASSIPRAAADGAWVYRVLLLRAERIKDVGPQLSDTALGELLGYPACCRAFFDETWGAGQVDTTYDQYRSTGDANGPIEANMLWRWMGIRGVPHLPCSFTCAATVEFGKRLREVAQQHGYREEARTIDEILGWPVTWSVVNGIAEIVGPCVKVSTRSDWSPEPRMFMRSGVYTEPVPELWSENRFSTAACMHASHIPLLSALQEHAPQGARVLDLGCGNGLLAKRLKARRPDIRIAGVDNRAEPLVRAAAGLSGTWLHQPIQNTNWTTLAPDVALVSMAHLLDMSPEDRAVTLSALATVPMIFTYGYSDCVHAYGSITQMCEKAGLPGMAVISANNSVQVGLIVRTG